MLPHWGIPLLFLCNACRKVWFSSLCLGPFFRRQQFLFLKRAPRRTHRPVPAALRLTLHGRRPARSFQFTRCVIRFRSSCFSKGDVPFHGQYIGVETSVFLNRCLFTGSSHTEVCMGPSALSRRMFKASCNRTCRPLFITEKTPAGNEILNGWKLRNAECFLRAHKRADSLCKTSSI